MPYQSANMRAISVATKRSPWPQTFLTVTLAMILWCMSAYAAMAEAGSMLAHPQAHAAYEALLQDPTDRKLNLKYSAMMSRGGDYEAAIPPLERLLISEPNNAWLMLQLGTLYHALGSNNMAATYVRRAMAEPSASDDVKQKSKQLLNRM